MSTQSRLNALGLHFSSVLLPADTIDLERWAVIACDQFTSDQEYWNAVEEEVGDAPSTLRMILPEIYLEREDEAVSTARIQNTMERYLTEGIFREVPDSAIFVRRTLPNGTVRRGLVTAIDLESYDYHPETRALVRASEETIPSRLPARAEIRKKAPLETPHVLVLYDDPHNTVMETLERHSGSLEELYSTPLMMGGGSITGHRVPEEHPAAAEAARALDALRKGTLLFATGDGNHSLAAAKTVWDERKASGAAATDPFRYCLVELVNVYDPGLPFHPIHRVCGGETARLVDSLQKKAGITIRSMNPPDLEAYLGRTHLAPNEFAFLARNQAAIVTITENETLPVEIVDSLLTEGTQEGTVTEIDYVHGLTEAGHAAERLEGIAWIVPEFDRDKLFPTVAAQGTLPRKAFSLGEARDKRYYLECRALR